MSTKFMDLARRNDQGISYIHPEELHERLSDRETMDLDRFMLENSKLIADGKECYFLDDVWRFFDNRD